MNIITKKHADNNGNNSNNRTCFSEIGLPRLSWFIYFEIAAATLLMTVNLASQSGKRYWNRASLDQLQRIFIVASGILRMSSQVATPFLKLWVEQFSRPGHAPHRDLGRDRNFAGVKQIKKPFWFRNENSGASRDAVALLMNFRIAVTGHKLWPFMKGNTTWAAIQYKDVILPV